MPSPQVSGQVPQSAGQLLHDSPELHWPSPQPGHRPQSLEQLVQLSGLSQTPSPQTAGQSPQSAGQLSQLSVAAQKLSPHRSGQSPQSAGQE